MRIDRLIFSGGFIAGVCSVLAVWAAVDLGFFDGSSVCDQTETKVSCARDWANVVAIIGAAGTIFFLAREQAFARKVRTEDQALMREERTFQSMSTRTKVDRVSRSTAYMIANLEMVRESAVRMSRMPRKAPAYRPHRVIAGLARWHQLFTSEIWKEALDLDGQLDADVREAKSLIELTLVALYDGRLDVNEIIMKRDSGFMFPDYEFSEDWVEILAESSFERLLTKIDVIERRLQAFAAAFRGGTLAEYFSRQNGAD